MQVSAERGSVSVRVLYTVARADAHVTDDREIIPSYIVNVPPAHFRVVRWPVISLSVVVVAVPSVRGRPYAL